MSNPTYKLNQTGDDIQEILDNALLKDGSNLSEEEASALRDKLGVTNGGGNANINDLSTSTKETWSSHKIEDELKKASLYEKLTIKELKADTGNGDRNYDKAEIGQTLESVIVQWGLNKKPTKITISGNKVDTLTTTGQFTLDVIGDATDWTSDFSYTLEVEDELMKATPKTNTIKFCNGIYYGVAPNETVTSEFIIALGNRILSDSKVSGIKANVTNNNYFWYCLPKTMEECKFTVGGFTGGFTEIHSNFQFTNGSGYTTYYRVYRSDNPSLGEITLTVS